MIGGGDALACPWCGRSKKVGYPDTAGQITRGSVGFAAEEAEYHNLDALELQDRDIAGGGAAIRACFGRNVRQPQAVNQHLASLAVDLPLAHVADDLGGGMLSLSVV